MYTFPLAQERAIDIEGQSIAIVLSMLASELWLHRGWAGDHCGA